MKDDEIKEESKLPVATEKANDEEQDMEADESEGDVEYIDDELIDEMDNDDVEESDDDFKTMKESDFGEDDQ